MDKKRKLRAGEREVSLKAWMANNSAISIAADCNVSRQAVNKASRHGRTVKLYVKNGVITYAYELIGVKEIWAWASL